LIAALEAEPGLVVGDNEPYLGGLEGDTIDRHAVRRGLPNALIEVRQDLIATRAEAGRWAERLAGALAPLLADLSSRNVRRFARVA
jgi:predicted N-formylglutamate amidohydrolase